MTAQGNALGRRGRSKARALKGRNTRAVAPFQGWAQGRPLRPRALPWAGVSCPFGAEDQAASLGIGKVVAPVGSPNGAQQGSPGQLGSPNGAQQGSPGQR